MWLREKSDFVWNARREGCVVWHDDKLDCILMDVLKGLFTATLPTRIVRCLGSTPSRAQCVPDNRLQNQESWIFLFVKKIPRSVGFLSLAWFVWTGEMSNHQEGVLETIWTWSVYHSLGPEEELTSRQKQWCRTVEADGEVNLIPPLYYSSFTGSCNTTAWVATSSCNRKAVVEIMDTEVRNEESSNLSWLL